MKYVRPFEVSLICCLFIVVHIPFALCVLLKQSHQLLWPVGKFKRKRLALVGFPLLGRTRWFAAVHSIVQRAEWFVQMGLRRLEEPQFGQRRMR